MGLGLGLAAVAAENPPVAQARMLPPPFLEAAVRIRGDSDSTRHGKGFARAALEHIMEDAYGAGSLSGAGIGARDKLWGRNDRAYGATLEAAKACVRVHQHIRTKAGGGSGSSEGPPED